MTIQEFKNYCFEKLETIYPKTEIQSFFFLLVDEYLQFSKTDVLLKPNFVIEDEKIDILQNAVNRLKKEEPIQYILGKTEFYGYPFLVDENVLIPRPETEELVEWIIAENKHKTQNINILDIGTGSGCVPISLKKELPSATIYTIDVSKKALKVAKQNAKINEVDIHFIEADILKTKNFTSLFLSEITFDVIVSNPPYVRNLEKQEMNNNVLQNEPHLALFVEDNNPLLFYNKIADLAKHHLTKDGDLFFEINQYLGEETVKLLEEKGFANIILKKDHFKNNRMIKASL